MRVSPYTSTSLSTNFSSYFKETESTATMPTTFNDDDDEDKVDEINVFGFWFQRLIMALSVAALGESISIMLVSKYESTGSRQNMMNGSQHGDRR